MTFFSVSRAVWKCISGNSPSCALWAMPPHNFTFPNSLSRILEMLSLGQVLGWWGLTWFWEKLRLLVSIKHKSRVSSQCDNPSLCCWQPVNTWLSRCLQGCTKTAQLLQVAFDTCISLDIGAALDQCFQKYFCNPSSTSSIRSFWCCTHLFKSLLMVN